MESPDDTKLPSRQLAAALGISRQRFYQLIGEARPRWNAYDRLGRKLAQKGRSARQEGRERDVYYSVSEVFRHPVGEARLRAARSLVEIVDEAAIMTSGFGTILCASPQAEVLLLRTSTSLLGAAIQDVGIPMSLEHRESRALELLRGYVGSAEPEILRIAERPADSTEPDLPRGVSRGRAKVAARALERVRARRPEFDWYVTRHPEGVPRIGGEGISVVASRHDIESARDTRVLDKSSTFPPSPGTRVTADGRVLDRLYRLHAPPLESLMLEHGAALVSNEPLRAGATLEQEWLPDYAARIARTFGCENVTFFFFPQRTPGAGEIQSDDSNIVGQPQFTALGSFGVPRALEGENFVLQGEEAGLVPEVALQRERCVVIDFGNEADRSRALEPNASNFELNSRFGGVKNAVLLPIRLEDDDGDDAGRRADYGVIRIFNCFGVAARSGRFEPLGPVECRHTAEKLEPIARSLALLYHLLLRAPFLDMVRETVEDLGQGSTFLGFLENLTQRAIDYLGCSGMAVRRHLLSDELELVTPPSAVSERVGDEHARRALSRGRVIDVPLVGGTVGSDDIASGGFEVPIRTPAGKIWGTVGYYDLTCARAQFSDRHYGQLKRLGETLARLIGVKSELVPLA